MKRPSFQFYPDAWMTNQKLRRCSAAARGAWLDIMCVLHDCDEYGVARYPLKELCRAAGVDLKHARELVEKHVLKGSDTDPVRFTWAPTHAGRKGEEVVLVESNGGPCWFCSRFVEDEHKRQRRGESTRFDSEENQPKRKPKSSPKEGNGEPEGYGPPSPSPSPSESITPETSSLAERPQGDQPSSERAQEPETPKPEPTAAGIACRLMRQAGCVQTNPSHPDLLAAIAEGVTPEALADTAREAVEKQAGRPFAWAIATARSRHAQGARTVVVANVQPIRAGLAQPSKTMQGLEALEAMKRGTLVSERNPDRAAEALHALAGPDTRR